MNLFTQNCISCRSGGTTEKEKTEEAQRTLFTTPHCRIVLRRDDQSWLGRCIIVPRKHISSSDCMSQEIREDIYRCREKIAQTYRKLFSMTYENWLQLGNLTKDHEGKDTDDLRYFHMHYHFIPRYRIAPKFLDKTFQDIQFGKALNIDPNSGHKKVVLDDETLIALKDTIQETMLIDGYISKENLKDAMPGKRANSIATKIEKLQQIAHYKSLTKIGLAVMGGLTITGGWLWKKSYL